MTPPMPPRVGTWLLYAVLAPGDRDVILGDLFEEYALRRTDCPAKAARWYLGQVCRSIPTVLLAGVRREGWALSVLIALGAYMIVGTLSLGATALTSILFGIETRSDGIAGIIVGLSAIAAGGYLAAWIRPGAVTVLGALVMIVTIVLMARPDDHTPVWYQLTFLVLGPVAAQGGGAIRLERHARRSRRAP